MTKINKESYLDWGKSYFNYACKKIIYLRCFRYRPDFFWFTGFIGTQMPYKVREATDKVFDIWTQNKCFSVLFLSISTVFTFPWTAAVMVFAAGFRSGSNLAIETAANKAIGVYNKTLKTPLDKPKEKALFEFLYTGKNLLTFESFYRILEKIKVLNDPIHTKLTKQFTKILNKEKMRVAKKIVRLKAQINNFSDPLLMTEIFNTFLDEALPSRA